VRPVVSVMRPAGPTAARDLLPGQRLVFGACRCGTCRFDLVVPAGPAGPVIGRISAHPDHWRLDNLGVVPLAVVDLEQSQSTITVPVGRAGAVVPFELSQVHDGRQPLAIVFGPEPVPPDPFAACPAVSGPDPPGPLDPAATYFAVLVALCEPRLRTPAGTAPPEGSGSLPTSPEIARTLARRGILVTPRAVDAHIEYLVEKLGVRDAAPATAAGRARRGWRKEAVVRAALREQLVRPEHIPAGQPGQRPAGVAQCQGDHR